MRATLRLRFFWFCQQTTSNIISNLSIEGKNNAPISRDGWLGGTPHVNDRFCAPSKNQTRPSEVPTRLERFKWISCRLSLKPEDSASALRMPLFNFTAISTFLTLQRASVSALLHERCYTLMTTNIPVRFLLDLDIYGP